MTTVTLYEDAGFGGAEKKFETPDDNLRNNLTGSSNPLNFNWDDEASSLKVEGGPVTFYESVGHDGAQWTLTAGSYDLGQMKALGIPNDEIGSFSW